MTLAERIEKLIEQHGSLRAAGRAIQIDPAYLSKLASGGKIAPSKTTLRRLGLNAVTTYELRTPNDI